MVYIYVRAGATGALSIAGIEVGGTNVAKYKFTRPGNLGRAG